MEIGLKLGQFCGLSPGILPSAFQGRQFWAGLGIAELAVLMKRMRKSASSQFKIRASDHAEFLPSKLISEQHLFTGHIENCV
jgi:hypothetical protein